MSKPFIKRLKISNFKSIDTLELHDVGPFSVFAGANGTGKSNFFDALVFFQKVMVSGAAEAVRSSGGADNLRNVLNISRNPEFLFGVEIECSMPTKWSTAYPDSVPLSYSTSIHEGEQIPHMEERLSAGQDEIITITRGGQATLFGFNDPSYSDRFRKDYPMLSRLQDMPIAEILRNIRVYRIDPNAGAGINGSAWDDTFLDVSGRNLAAVLSRMENEPNIREEIREWMEFIVPSVESVSIERSHLEQRSEIVFKEKHSERAFPAGFVSQGTMFALSLLVAILDKPSPLSLTLIEEPERGLHPKAIGELIQLMRETATPEHAIWITTHSETVVRNTKLSELWLVDRKEGSTSMKHASDGNLTDDDIRPFGMDEAWLSNLLGAGLPW